MERTCSNCSTTFTIEKKRGRPHVKCESCRSEKVARLRSKTAVTRTAFPEIVEEKPKRKFKDEPTKGNERYSREEFIQYMEEYGVPIGAQAVAQAIKIVKEGWTGNVPS